VTGKPKIPNELIKWVRLGTILATNAFLERKGTKSTLLIAKGFGDLLTIRKQNRPHIFELNIEKPSPLYESVIEIDERVRILSSDEFELLL
jgi:5-oxoprolinase (ATP-hydrolysing)